MFFGKQQGRHTLDCRQAGVGRSAQQYVQAARDEVQFANESARLHMVTRILQIGQQAESTMSEQPMTVLGQLHSVAEQVLETQSRTLIAEVVEEIGRQKSTKFSLESWVRISTRNRSQRPVNHQLRRSNLEDIVRLRPKVTHAQENTHSVRLCVNPPEALWPTNPSHELDFWVNMETHFKLDVSVCCYQ